VSGRFLGQEEPKMGSTRWYVTSAIPYVNAAPHLGHALEFVQADTLARWRRSHGDEVRSLWGTDDHAGKNVQAAQAAGEDTASFVDRHADAFAGLRDPLQLGFDDFLRTSRDPRHRPAVEHIWRSCEAAGDLYRGRYEGLYCGGCERFYDPDELPGGRCPEHGAAPHRVVEENWYFRLSRYADQIAGAIRRGELRVEPAHRRNEILSFLDGDVRDISVSRPAARSAGWGIPVPGDPDQVVYVWFDALTNYISALGYGTEDPDYRRWWHRADRRVHVIGKGILRFHAAYWPAFLLSAGEPLPTDVLVHEYVTIDATKISKSAGTSVAPTALTDEYGSDALRWWLLSDVNAVGDTDFRVQRLIERHDQDLANTVGNLITRLQGLLHRYGQVPDIHAVPAVPDGPSALLRETLPAIDAAIDHLDLRTATRHLIAVVAAANGYINLHRPWELVGSDTDHDAAGPILAELLGFCRELSRRITAFLPETASHISERLAAPLHGPRDPLFPRLAATERTGVRQGAG
jgi:methionyl-tRNA synthetase